MTQGSEMQASFGEFLPATATATTDLYAQLAFDPLSYTIWGDDTGFDDAGDNASNTMGDMASISPLATAHLGSSYGDMDTLSRPGGGEAAWAREINMDGTAGPATYSSASTTAASSAPTTTPLSASTSGTTPLSASTTSTSLPTSKTPKRSPSSTTTASPGPKPTLRSASRAPKNSTAHKRGGSSESASSRRSRASHNSVERQYRDRLNAHFESLLDALPAPSAADDQDAPGAAGERRRRRVSKGEVLDMGRRRIRDLEERRASLRGERDGLRGELERLGEVCKEEDGKGKGVEDGADG
ncbi:hypothetical protein CONLIGDRAFT_205155 [Coniochaeta ligniaria NRRL 30616]|uniref:BHLH domain-containing protein n=1 Tax=Coniochaeta ligniaria NRRL 30616 TaxID=1408157 RepID=A0A1J7J3H2_9PEZI|nr:hypothetical protein CONLIGDRAFT_205155 [Coniochaeta ligniaria NRRL 30616]